jgi:hypothetical protein
MLNSTLENPASQPLIHIILNRQQRSRRRRVLRYTRRCILFSLRVRLKRLLPPPRAFAGTALSLPTPTKIKNRAITYNGLSTLFDVYSFKVYNPTSSNNSFLSGCVHSPVCSFFFGRFFHNCLKEHTANPGFHVLTPQETRYHFPRLTGLVRLPRIACVSYHPSS